MKKIITILLVFSIAFVAFAETGLGTTTLNLGLQAEISGKLFHGFTNADNTTANDIKSELSGAGTGNINVSINLESDDVQPIGYYNLYTTGNAQIVVKFTTTPITMAIGTTSYYVPYKLAYEASSGNSRVTVSGTDIGAATVATTVNPGSSTPTTVLTTNHNGLRWKTLSLSAQFAGTQNETFGLPESVGEGYKGTIVAAVTALN